MSWSRTVSGTPSAVRKQVEEYVSEVERVDRIGEVSDALANAHRAQVESAVGAVFGVTEKLPETVSITGSIYGSAIEPTTGPITGTVGVNLTISGTFE